MTKPQVKPVIPSKARDLLLLFRHIAMKQFHVYILASRSGTLYVGVTSDLFRRIYEHRQHLVPGHTQRYRITRLVHYEDAGPDAYAAIDREKQIKGWRRQKKVELITSGNPTWEDLATDWYD